MQFKFFGFKHLKLFKIVRSSRTIRKIIDIWKF